MAECRDDMSVIDAIIDAAHVPLSTVIYTG